MTFIEIENIAGIPIGHSFLKYKKALLVCILILNLEKCE